MILQNGSVVRHKNGIEYVVIGFANEDTQCADRYPVMCLYQNLRGHRRLWCRPLKSMKESFTLVPQLEDEDNGNESN